MAPEETQYPFAQVLVDLDAKALDRRTFSYRIPDGMEQGIEVGTPVSVPFGRMKLITGYVVGFSHYVEPGIRVKEIADILDEQPLFDVDFLQFLDWVAQYYATPLMTVLSTALPTSIVQKTKREVILESVTLSSEYTYSLPRHVQQILAYLKGSAKSHKGIGIRYLSTQTGLPLRLVNQSLYKLRQDGLVRIQSRTKAGMGQKTMKWLRVLPKSENHSLTKRQGEILDRLSQLPSPEMKLTDASTLAQTTTATLQKLADQGCIEIFEAPEHRDRLLVNHFSAPKLSTPLILNEEQERAVESVLSAEPGASRLLYGVTGSGKTEVYLSLTQSMLAEGKSILVLVPEISLTSHLAKRFIERFGREQIALWHSQLSAGEKVDTWRRIHNGDLKIMIGARSAIFTPIQNLGLIILDEAHDGSFKQDSPAPRYHAVTLAKEMAKRYDAKVLLGSATPDVEIYYQALQDKAVLRLDKRYGGRSLAEVSLVDMRQTKASGGRGTLSAELKLALEETLHLGQQAIILLNRRGFYTLIVCNECEEVFQCPHCAVALTYHRYREQVRCHYCGYEAEKPAFCPKCASFNLQFTGMGTQRLEEEIAQCLPDARILRLDSDVMQKKFAHREIFDAFDRHEADILIGTQMVAKGLDIANVTLVGVVNADTAFSLPDYKAAERGFQLLTQVAGRAGRGDQKGRVIVQSLQPSHPVILRAQAQDYEGFYQDELVRRQEFGFPPFSQLFRMIASCTDELKLRQFMDVLAISLKHILEEATLQQVVQVLGPAPCIITRIQGRYRYHMMIKNTYGDVAHQIITRFFKGVEPPQDINFFLDVDAQSFL